MIAFLASSAFLSVIIHHPVCHAGVTPFFLGSLAFSRQASVLASDLTFPPLRPIFAMYFRTSSFISFACFPELDSQIGSDILLILPELRHEGRVKFTACPSVSIVSVSSR